MSKRSTLPKVIIFAVVLSSVKMVADRHIYAAYQALTTSFLGMSTSMTLNDSEP